MSIVCLEYVDGHQADNSCFVQKEGETHVDLSMIQTAMVYKSYHPWSWSSTSSLVLNHGWSKSPYDSCTYSTAELQPTEPISSFRQRRRRRRRPRAV